MKTKFWIILLAIITAVCLLISIPMLLPGENAARAEISSEGTVIKIVDLHVDQQFTVTAKNGGTNTITVQNGKIAVTQASCPDHYCMDRGFCAGGTQIVCLPNRLVIRFLGAQDVDAAVG